MEAFDAAADPDRYPGSGEPWQPLKLYYFVSFHRARFAALHEEMLAARAGVAVRGVVRGWDDEDRAPARPRAGDHHPRPVRATTSRIRDQALIAHATQIDPESSWFRLPAGGPAGGVADRGLSPGQVRGGY